MKLVFFARFNCRRLLIVLSIIIIVILVSINLNGNDFTQHFNQVHQLTTVKMKRFGGNELCQNGQDDFQKLFEIDFPTNSILTEYVQCHHLTPPSHLPYNLTNRRIDPSEHAQDIRKIFRRMRRPGVFIECGANNGEYLSNTLALEYDRKWKGLLIEADPNLVQQIGQRHRKAWVADVCLSPQNKVMELEFLTNNETDAQWKSGTGRLNLEDNVDDKVKHESMGKIKCFPLITILTALKIKHVDYFSLDIQGAELKVLKTLPYDETLRINVIHAEVALAPEGPDEMTSFMESKGYKLKTKVGYDFIFIHQDWNGT